jgi:hypothetical protein
MGLASSVLGMVLATWWGWSSVPSIVLAIVLAFAFGYSLTITPVPRSGLSLRRAIAVAVAADTVSIATMELMDPLPHVAYARCPSVSAEGADRGQLAGPRPASDGCAVHAEHLSHLSRR